MAQPAACVDVGSHSVRVLVAAPDGAGGLDVRLDRGEVTALGRDLEVTRRLDPDAVERTADAVARLTAAARDAGAGRIRAVGTEALRIAGNRKEFLWALREREPDLHCDILGAAEEAELAFLGVTAGSDPGDGRPVIVCDIGGGSVEVVAGRPGEPPSWDVSLPLGSVRMTEKFTPLDDDGRVHDPDDGARALTAHVRGRLGDTARWASDPEAAGPEEGRALTVLGGGATAAAMLELGLDEFDEAAVDGFEFDLATIAERAHELLHMTVAEREARGVAPGRADVLPAGLLVLGQVMIACRAPVARVSVRGLRHGVVLDLLRRSGST